MRSAGADRKDSGTTSETEAGAKRLVGALLIPWGEAMRRCDFIKGIVGSATAWPLTTRAQQSARLSQVAIFTLAPIFGRPSRMRLINTT